ncbi:MAG: hypothetical protein ABUT39_20630 [Acidobacteriota bacterium]
MKGSRIGTVVIALAMVVAWSCRRSGISADNEKARNLWIHHQEAIEAVVEGRGKIGPDFIAAAKFFRETTGVQVHFTGDFIGLVPTERTAEDLKDLEKWFNENEDRLSWDEKSQRVILSSGL